MPENTNSDTFLASDAFAADLLRGHTDTIVLAVLSQGESYGFEIFKTIRDATGGAYEIKEATLYASYRRLLKDGLVEAYWGDETQGGRRKYYRITDAGRAVYRDNIGAWEITRGLIDTLLDLGRPARTGTTRPGRRQQ
ncbi:PadR family transcriptional regulator [Catellatospora methionotrophica]|uniref:PadR family transcriptional regulator n=1 Tax=Catellatospora methionotrophica TaxID=121620 RepID=UPI0033DAC576